MLLQVKLVSSLTEGTTRTVASLWSTPVEASSPKVILLEPQVHRCHTSQLKVVEMGHLFCRISVL